MLALAPWMIPAVDLLPMIQAGGGGGFGGGGGDGDGGGIAILVYYLFEFLIRYAISDPVRGVPLLVFATVVFLWLLNRGRVASRKALHRRNIRKNRRHRQGVRSATSSAVLQASDQAFDEPAFLRRVEAAFKRTQTAWCDQDLKPVSAFLSDGVFERFSLQIEEQQREGWFQGMQDLHLRKSYISDVDVGERYDRLTVRISFKADIHRCSIESGKKIMHSSLQRESFAEAWTFLRGHGTKTLNGNGLMEGQCPNCGADLVMGQSAKCEHCNCMARSGQFDWVLAEITQWSEWAPESAERIPGRKAFQAIDPGWHPQILEDLASVVFWRKLSADLRGSTNLLERFATGSFLEGLVTRWERKAKSGTRKRHLIDCAVGSVRTVAVLPGEDWDRAVVEIVWDGKYSVDGEVRHSARTRRCKYMVFSRMAGTKTKESRAFTTAHCQNCGAHDDGGDEPTCRFCDAPRTGDPTVWLLEAFVGRGTPEGSSLFAEIRALETVESSAEPTSPPTSAMNLLTWATGMAHADGTLSPAEQKAIHALAAHTRASVQDTDALLQDPPRFSELPHPENKEQALAWIEELTAVAMEDGTVSRKEMKFLQRSAQRLGIPAKDYNRTVNSVHTSVYRESRAAKRHARQESQK